MPSPVLINGGTALEWAVENPILPLGFVGIESDTGKSKKGNGKNSWNSLAEYKKPDKVLEFIGQILVPSLAAANAATYAQSGNTITVTSPGHNIPNTLYNGATIYLAIGAVSTGVAPTAEIANFFTNFQWISANSFSCQATNSQTGTGVVNTNLAATTLTPVVGSIPANTINFGSYISSYGTFSNNNSAGTKACYTQLNAVSIGFASATSTINTLISLPNTASFPSIGRCIRSANIASPYSYDLTTTLPVSVLCVLTAANDYICLEQLTVILNRARQL